MPYARCERIRGQPKCRCPVDCKNTKGKVCGSDGETYLSVCELQVVACTTNRMVTVAHNGGCKPSEYSCLHVIDFILLRFITMIFEPLTRAMLVQRFYQLIYFLLQIHFTKSKIKNEEKLWKMRQPKAQKCSIFQLSLIKVKISFFKLHYLIL